MLSIAEVRTEVILWLLYSVFFHLWRGSGGGGWNPSFPLEAVRPKARTCLCWLFSGLFSGLFPRTQAVYPFARLLKSSLQNHEAAS